MRAVEIVIDTRRVVRWVIGACIAFELLFLFLDYHVNYGHATEIGALRRMTNIAREDGLASWFGTTQTLLISLTLWLLFLIARKVWPGTWQSRGWLVLALFFTFMAVDDGAQLHERFGTALDELSDPHDPSDATAPDSRGLLDGFPSYAWQVLFLPVFATLGIFLFVFLMRELPRPRSRLLVVSALACLVLAVALDFFEGLDEQHPWNVYTLLVQRFDFGDWCAYRFRATAFDTVAHFSKAIEESLEMLGNTLLWQVFLVRLSEIATGFQVRFLGR